MGGIPEDVIDRIQDSVDIVSLISSYVPLRGHGDDYWACCPFHEEKTPSFKVSASRQVYYCFGCQRSGNLFHFVMAQENLDFTGAVRLMAQHCGIRIPDSQDRGDEKKSDSRHSDKPDKDQLFQLLQEMCAWYQQQLKDAAGQEARNYLANRGLDDEDVIQTFQLGYAPDSWDAAINWARRQGYSREMLVQAGMAIRKDSGHCYDRFRGRLMFPIHDELGRVIGFSGRLIGKEDTAAAKYINTPDTWLFRKNRVLYGLYKARREFKQHGCALVCEGQLDVIACHRAGLPYAVAPQGTAFTDSHARILNRYTDTVVFAFDADAAGLKAAYRSIKVALSNNLRARVAIMPAGEDPDNILRDKGAGKLQEIAGEPEDAFDFLLRNGKERHSTESPEGKTALAKEMLDVLSFIPDTVTRATRCQWLSKALHLPEDAVFDYLSEKLKSSKSQQRRSTFASSASSSASGTADSREAGDTAVFEGNEEKTLLDLVLHFPEISEHLAERLSSDRISTSECGKALEKMLTATLELGWQDALRSVRADAQFMSVPAIGRLMAESRFSGLDPEKSDISQEEAESRRQKLFKAMNDCLTRLEEQYLERRAQSVEEQMRHETDPEQARKLLMEGAALRRKREELKHLVG